MAPSNVRLGFFGFITNRLLDECGASARKKLSRRTTAAPKI